MHDGIVMAILASGIVAGTPILLACLGELLGQRAGVMNLGVEGMMLVGAVSGVAVSIQSRNQWAGLGAAILAGGLMALIHAFLTITLRAKQEVSGLALTIFGTGLSGYVGKSYVGTPVPATFKPVEVPMLSDIPWIGDVLFKHDAMVYISMILVGVVWFILYKTKTGLVLRAAGENPGAIDAAGIHVFRVRYVYTIIGGMLSGAAGAYLSLAYAPSWIESMTAGRGWIAVSLVIFSMWNPVRALAGAYIFGMIDSLGFHMQTIGVMIPSFFLKMLPYVFTFLVLVLMTRETKSRRVATPEALGLPYVREER